MTSKGRLNLSWIIFFFRSLYGDHTLKSCCFFFVIGDADDDNYAATAADNNNISRMYMLCYSIQFQCKTGHTKADDLGAPYTFKKMR